jgi:hypothetical protein
VSLIKAVATAPPPFGSVELAVVGAAPVPKSMVIRSPALQAYSGNRFLAGSSRISLDAHPDCGPVSSSCGGEGRTRAQS